MKDVSWFSCELIICISQHKKTHYPLILNDFLIQG